VRIIRCGCRLSGRAGRSATTTSLCVRRVQSRMPRFHRDGQFSPTRCRHPLRHSTVRRNRYNHNTVHRNMLHRPVHCLNTVPRKLCPRSLARRKRQVTRFPLHSKPGHRCRSILRASRHRKKMISIFSLVRRARTAPRAQAPRRQRIHRVAIRRRITRPVTLLQITRSRVMRRTTHHQAPSRCRPDRRNQLRSARRAHRSSPERLDRLK